MHDLDKKDLAIIRELDFNARMSISSLARKVRLSKEVANYRLKKLLERNIIKSFNAIIDPYIFGYQLYSLRIKFRQPAGPKKHELIRWVRSHGNAARIAELGGNWNLSVLFWSKNPVEFSKIYDYILEKYGSIIMKKALSVIVDMEHMAYNFLYEKPSSESFRIGKPGNEELDKKDAQILDLLSKQGRMPLIEIANKTRMTANAVKYRMKSLEERKIIKGYTTVLNNQYFGLAHYRITLYLSDSSKKKTAKELLRAEDDVVLITDLLGHGDVRFEVLCPTIMRVYALVEKMNTLSPNLVRDFDDILMLSGDVIDYFPSN